MLQSAADRNIPLLYPVTCAAGGDLQTSEQSSGRDLAAAEEASFTMWRREVYIYIYIYICLSIYLLFIQGNAVAHFVGALRVVEIFH
jgi:hypothetical protein